MAKRAVLIEAAGADERPGAHAPRDALRLSGSGSAGRAFLESWASGRFHHAWLLCGQEGVGKASFAWLAARFVLSGGRLDRAEPLLPDPDHQANHLISAGSHPDLALVRREWDESRKKHRGEITVDAIRQMREAFQLAAGLGGHRVAIIDAADDLNTSAANALLKLLEEPPPRSLFLIVCHNPSRLLPTIRSRCRRLNFADLQSAEVEAILKNQPISETVDAGAITQAAALSQGSVARAMRYLDRTAIDLRGKADAVLRDLPRIDAGRWLALSRDLSRKDIDAMGVFREAAEEFAMKRAKLAGAAASAMAMAETSGDIGRLAIQAEIYNLDPSATALAMLQKLQAALR
jgi:DNA polymerase III subunit delta'